MAKSPDIVIHLPAEHFDALSEVFATGLQRANIDPYVRKELRDWWTAEKEFIEDDLEKHE